MVLGLGPLSSIGFASQPQNTQSQTSEPADTTPGSSQTQSQAQSAPPPARENQPVTGTLSSKTESDASARRPAETETAVRVARRAALPPPPPSEAASGSVFDAQTAAAETADADLTSARREAEAARQAYTAQAVIDSVQTATQASIASLFETPEVEKPSEADTGAANTTQDADATVAEDLFAKAD